MKPPDIPYGVAGRVCDALMVVVKWSVPHLKGSKKEKKIWFSVACSVCVWLVGYLVYIGTS